MSVKISIEDVSKEFGDIVALNSVTAEVSPGELFGFIGPDGAGKTTLFRVITSLLVPTSGVVNVGDLNVVSDYKKLRKIIGYMPGRFSLYMDLTVEENLNFYASIFNTSLNENYDLIRDIYEQIEPFKKRRAGNLSGGMKQKLALSCALIHSPKLIVLDEPTTGVDAVSRVEFWELLKKMQKRGITIIVSTPYMDEAALCDRVALMQEGTLMAVDSPQKIVNSYTGTLFSVSVDNMHTIIKDLSMLEDALHVFRFGEKVHVTTKSENTEAFQNNLKNFLISKGYGDIAFAETEPVIEDCFLSLMEKFSNK